MLFLLSPAKALDYDTPPPLGLPHTQPQFVRESAALIKLLKTKPAAEISALMDLSESLTALNVARYKAWRTRFTLENSKQAVLAFDGDVYGGLDAKTLKHAQLQWAQAHVRMLSGLYGLLRPLDLMQPYRLEMGAALANSRGKNLYAYWGEQIATHLSQELQGDTAPVVVNLASQEYFKVVDPRRLHARVIECVFQECKNGQFKVISFMAKRARGLMARYAIENRISTPKKLQAFCSEGYTFAPEVSSVDRYVFRRSI